MKKRMAATVVIGALIGLIVGVLIVGTMTTDETRPARPADRDPAPIVVTITGAPNPVNEPTPPIEIPLDESGAPREDQP